MPRTLEHRLRDDFDWPLFLATLMIAITGIANLYSTASVSNVQDRYISQIYWVALGAVGALVVAAIDYRHFERYGYVLYAVGNILLVAVLLFAREVKGSHRWLGIGGYGIQPSELMKVMLVIALAKYLHHDPKYEGRTVKDLAIPGAMTLLPVLLILKEPDLGTSLLLFLIFISTMLLTQLKPRSFITLGIVAVLAMPLTWNYLLEPYQKARIVSFVNPEADKLGTGWHSNQSIVAIGSGRLVGKGFRHSTQNQYRFLPEQNTDFPFTVFAEEQGFIGSIVMLSLYCFLILWSLRIASQAKDRFGAVLAVGIGSIFFWQVLFNIGMVTGILPVVGITLPLFSYGGSSTLSILLGIGLLMNVSIRRFRR